MQWPANLLDPAYAPMVLGAVAEGRFVHTFVPLVVEAGGHRATFYVSQDALEVDGVRVDVSAILQQHIADILGAHLVTPRLLDQMWAQRSVTILPCTQPITSSATGMVGHSACVDKQVAQVTVPPNGVVQTVGKTWVLSNKLTATVAMNAGWYIEKPIAGVPFDPAPTLPGAHMIQSPGTRHGPNHVDYSQVALFVKSECTVDSQPSTFATVAQTSALAALVSSEGVLRILRQPGASDLVTPPTTAPKPVDGATIALTSVGAGIGAAVAGPAGALVGGAAGWAADAVRRKLMA